MGDVNQSASSRAPSAGEGFGNFTASAEGGGGWRRVEEGNTTSRLTQGWSFRAEGSTVGTPLGAHRTNKDADTEDAGDKGGHHLTKTAATGRLTTLPPVLSQQHSSCLFCRVNLISSAADGLCLLTGCLLTGLFPLCCLLGLLFLLPFLLLLVLLFQSFMLQFQSARGARGEHTVQTFIQQVSAAVMMAGAVLRMMGNVSVSALTRPKEILKQTKRTIYSKPPRHKIGAAQSFFVMSVFAVAMLAPAAWILHHLPEYRQRSRQSPKT